MATFAYRILPPRAKFWATIEPHEVALMVRHLEHLRRLKEEGTVRFVDRAGNGNYGFVLIESEDEAHDAAIARSDPAVAEEPMRLELHAFVVVFDSATTERYEAAQGMSPPV